MKKQRRFLLLVLFLCGLACIPAIAQQPNTNSGISGTVQFDYTDDCISDIDSFFYNTTVRAWQNGTLVATGTVGLQGEYFIPVESGTYRVVPDKLNAGFIFCLSDTLTATVVALDTTENIDFVFQYDPQPITAISGYVYQDVDNDCLHDAFEVGVEGWPVFIRLLTGGAVQNYYDTTDANGYYEVLHPPGANTDANILVSAFEAPGNGLICSFPCDAAVVPSFLNSNAFEGNIAVQCDSLLPCAQLEVSIATNVLRPCVASIYSVRYCNIGALTATNALVQVTVDPALQVIGSDLPWTTQSGNVYTFEVGDLLPDECGDFALEVKVPCNDPVGTTYCSAAHAYPDTSCAPVLANWDGSKIEVVAACVGDSVVFTIKNVGLGNMQNELNYIVIEDNILVMPAPGKFKLTAGASITASFPANGTFLRIEAGQSPGFAGLNTPVAWAEGCNGSGNMSFGFVNQYPLGDEDPWLDMFCLESVNSYDPNDKNGFPRGIEAAHYIDQNVELEYLIRFQNTGTAPALNIEIRDTLPVQWLDPTTVRPGAGSHTYQWDVQGNGVVVFRFDDIHLPDSAASPINSQGFVQFRVRQRQNVPLGTKIENTAAIYFDNNAPVITNQTLHTVGKDFVLTSTPTLLLPDVRVQIVPNPLTSQAQVRVEGLKNTEKMNFTLYSLLSKTVLTGQFNGENFDFQTGQLPPGVYFYEVRSGGKIVGKGKLVKM